MRYFSLLSFALFVFHKDMFEVSAMNNSSIATSPTTSINQLSSTINPSPTTTITQPSSSAKNTAQVSAGGSLDNIEVVNIPLPPDSERLDYDLVANTRMKWIVHLLDPTGPEFVFMEKLLEKTFNEAFKSVPGFIKTKLSEFQQEKVTFILTIYTKKAAAVSQARLEKAVESYLAAGDDVFKIYKYEVKPRFREIPPDTNKAPVYLGSITPPENVSLFMNFIRGFGIAIAMVVIFTVIVVIKYKISQACKSKHQDDTKPLKQGFDNDGME